MKRTLHNDGIRPFPGKKTMLYEVENDVFLANRGCSKIEPPYKTGSTGGSVKKQR